jgi:hypothetical protein
VLCRACPSSQVKQAPEPSLILWENLQYGFTDRLRRKITTTIAAGSLIVISIIIAFVARYYQVKNPLIPKRCDRYPTAAIR